MKKMKRFIYILAPLLAVLSFWSCSVEELRELPASEGTALLGLSFPISRGVGDSDPNDNVLNQVRVIIFRSNNVGAELGVPVLNKVYLSPTTPGTDKIDISEIVPVGYLNIYLIGNETEDANLNTGTPLNSITASSQIISKSLNYTPVAGNHVLPPFVMYSVYKAVHVDVNGTISHSELITGGGITTFPILRTAAKYTINVDCDFADLQGRQIWIDKAQIVSMPLTPGLSTKEYPASGAFFSSDWLSLTPFIRYKQPGDPNYTGPNEGIITNTGFVFYLPEHVMNNADRSHYTYLVLVGHLGYGTGATITYTVPLGNGLGVGGNTPAHLMANYATVPAADLSVSRNTHYELNLFIKGLGERSDIEVLVTIKPWDTVLINDDPNPPYLNVSTTTTTVNGLVSQRIYFWTNQEDAYLELQGMATDSHSGTPFTVNSVFQNVAGPEVASVRPANFYFDPNTGSGYFDIILDTNTPIPATRYLVYLRASNLRREIEIFTTNDPPASWTSNKWVGTFHRATEKGERIISGGNTGAWTATVEDPSGAGSFVILGDKFGINDTQLYTANPGNAEDYPVLGNLKTVSGTGNILFRVGLTGTYSPTALAPARYARIILTYNNNASTDYIYVRQGEEPDYVMRPTDASGGNMSAGTRPLARKFSPYNLTAQEFKSGTAIGGAALSSHPQIAQRTSTSGGGVMVDYPTQAGAMFAYQSTTHARTAIHPMNPVGAISPAPSTVGGFWDEGTQETCPPGYRRPQDGDPANFTTLLADDSEIRQSLWVYAQNGSSAANGNNALRGFYADGYFDRRKIESSPNSVASSTVALENPGNNVAYKGLLFFNPNNHASLFFPAAGYRFTNGSPLYDSGSYGYYLTSALDATQSLPMKMTFDVSTSNSAGLSPNAWINFYQSIRCVRPDIVAPSYVWLSPSPGNGAKTIQIESNSGWTLQGSQPANASLSVTSGGAGVTNLTLTKNSTTGLSSFTVVSGTGERVIITVDSFYIEEDDEFMIPNALLLNNTAAYEIEVIGGDEAFVIVGVSDPWIVASIDPDGKLRLTADQSPNQEEREGTITIAHINDPTYQVTFPVIQDFYTDIPPFRYFVVWFTWPAGGDVDIAVEFADNYMADNPSVLVPFDNNSTYNTGTGTSRAMGFYYATHLYIDGTRGVIDATGVNNPIIDAPANIAPNFSPQILEQGLMFWGGDAMSGEGETVFFNAPQITPPSRREDNTGLPRLIKLELYAGRRAVALTTTISTYEDGIMLKPTAAHPQEPAINRFNFINVPDGTTITDVMNSTTPWSVVNTPSWTLSSVNTIGSGAPNTTFRTSSTHVATITYDRYRRSARVDWHAPAVSPAPSPAPLLMAPQMTQDEIKAAAAAKDAQTAAAAKR